MGGLIFRKGGSFSHASARAEVKIFLKYFQQLMLSLQYHGVLPPPFQGKACHPFKQPLDRYKE